MMRSKLVSSPALLPWRPLVLLSLASWLGATLLLDCLVMPVLYAGGMISQSGFASVGYALFGAFNHVELLLGSVVLAGLMALVRPQDWLHAPSASSETREAAYWRVLWPALVLFAIPLLYNYGLTPYMSALGLSLTEAAVEPSVSMNAMHAAYWGLEVIKLGAIALLLYRLSGSFGLDSGFSEVNGGTDDRSSNRFDLAKPE